MLSSILGALGIVANMLIYQQKSGKSLLIFKLVSDFLWAAHYFLISANAAAAIAAINIFREIVFFYQNKRQTSNRLWLIFFLVCSLVSAVLTWKNVFSLLPAAASAISVISFWRSSPKLSRALAFPISASMLTYDIGCGSYMGIINEILTLISATVGIFRYNKDK